jgi:hypothetical protein
MSTPERVNAADVDRLRFEARYCLRAKQERERALALALEAYAMLDRMDATDLERGDACAGLSSLFLDLGDDERCESLAIQAIQIEAALDQPRPVLLGTRQLFYAMFLHERGRFVEAGRQATDGLTWYARGVAADDRELAYVRTHMEPVLRAAREHPAS